MDGDELPEHLVINQVTSEEIREILTQGRLEEREDAKEKYKVDTIEKIFRTILSYRHWRVPTDMTVEQIEQNNGEFEIKTTYNRETNTRTLHLYSTEELWERDVQRYGSGSIKIPDMYDLIKNYKFGSSTSSIDEFVINNGSQFPFKLTKLFFDKLGEWYGILKVESALYKLRLANHIAREIRDSKRNQNENDDTESIINNDDDNGLFPEELKESLLIQPLNELKEFPKFIFFHKPLSGEHFQIVMAPVEANLKKLALFTAPDHARKFAEKFNLEMKYATTLPGDDLFSKVKYMDKLDGIHFNFGIDDQKAYKEFEVLSSFFDILYREEEEQK